MDSGSQSGIKVYLGVKMPTVDELKRNALLVAALGAVVVSLAHTFVVYYFAVSVPFADQWDAEFTLYKAFIENKLSVELLMAAHNEHRILMTRLFVLGVFELMGGWSLKAEAFGQIFLLASWIIFFVYVGCTFLTTFRRQWIFMGITAVMYSLPYAYPNILIGFQNGFYFLLLFSSFGIYLAATFRKYLSMIFLLVIAFLLPFTLGSGIIAQVIMLAIVIFRIFTQRELRFGKIVVSQSVLISIFISLKLYVAVPGHVQFQAHNFRDFIFVAAKNFAWPGIIGGLAIWLVYSLLLLDKIKMSGGFFNFLEKIDRVDLYLLGLTAFVVIHLLAIAYTRGHHGDGVSARYLQIHALTLPIGILFFFRSQRKYRPRLLLYGGLALGFTVALGLAMTLRKHVPSMRNFSSSQAIEREEILKLIQSGDSQNFLNQTALITGQSRARVFQVLSDLEMRKYQLWLMQGKSTRVKL